MARSRFTADFYAVLEVDQTATLEVITQSYKRLALKLHPDRNSKANATAAFQLLASAYETLKDKGQRNDYDREYPFIRKTQKPRPPNAPTHSSTSLDEHGQIAQIYKSKQERGVRWSTSQQAFDRSISELQKSIRDLEQKLRNLRSTAAAEAAAKAQENSWTTWILSPLYKKMEKSEEARSAKERAIQERLVEKNMKERRLETKMAEMKMEQDRVAKAREEVNAADRVDDAKIQKLRYIIWAREVREKEEKDKMEREKQAKAWREQQEKRDREAAEAMRMWQEERERQEKEWKRQQEQAREREFHSPQGRYAQPRTSGSGSSCQHYGWWSKAQGRQSCPKCSESWPYLLQCPGCQTKACPKCQADIRRRRKR